MSADQTTAIVRRLTKRDFRAIEAALNQVLAGPLDGIEEGSEEEAEMIDAMVSALTKVQERLP